MATTHARGTFDVEMHPAESLAGDRIAQLSLTKTYHGDLTGTGEGRMLSSGDPQSGNAGYVALEVAIVDHGQRSGSFALQQSGQLQDGSPTLDYAVVPGSGTGGFAGVTGALALTIDEDGVHHYDLIYTLPD